MHYKKHTTELSNLKTVLELQKKHHFEIGSKRQKLSHTLGRIVLFLYLEVAAAGVCALSKV